MYLCDPGAPGDAPIKQALTDSGKGVSTGRSVSVGTHDLRAQDRLVQRELAVELLDRRGLGRQVDDGVDALGVLLDLVRHPATTPHVDGLDRAAVLADHVEVLVERRLDGALVETRVEDDHHFIGTHSGLHLLWARAATGFPWQEDCAFAAVGTTWVVRCGRPKATGEGYQRAAARPESSYDPCGRRAHGTAPPSYRRRVPTVPARSSAVVAGRYVLL